MAHQASITVPCRALVCLHAGCWKPDRNSADCKFSHRRSSMVLHICTGITDSFISNGPCALLGDRNASELRRLQVNKVILERILQQHDLLLRSDEGKRFFKVRQDALPKHTNVGNVCIVTLQGSAARLFNAASSDFGAVRTVCILSKKGF